MSHNKALQRTAKPPLNLIVRHFLMLRIIVFCTLIVFLNGCAWVGVEIVRPELENTNSINPEYALKIDNYTGKYSYQVGTAKNQILETLPVVKQELSADKKYETYVYYTDEYAWSGAVVCVIWLPIPLALPLSGKEYYKLTFLDDKLAEIERFMTRGQGFYGVYLDDSGRGFLWGEKSKCNMF